MGIRLGSPYLRSNSLAARDDYQIRATRARSESSPVGARDVVLDGLVRLTTWGFEPTDAKNTKRSLLKLLIDHALAAGYTRCELSFAMEMLKLEGILKRGVGQYANRTQKYVLVLVERGARADDPPLHRLTDR
jgi:hypothetical protein